MTAVPLTEEDLHDLYLWVDELPISRPKRNIARDFADGCCVAEIVKFFFPRLVELHNYIPAMSMSKKRDNWNTLNKRVFRKLYFEVPSEEIEDIISAVPGAIERFLRALRTKIAQIKSTREEEDGWEGAPPPSRAQILSSSSPAAGRVGSSAGAPRQRPPAVVGDNNNQQYQEEEAAAARYGNVNHNSASRPSSHAENGVQRLVDEKDRTILELRETVGILSDKIMKLEELVRVKDDKLQQYRAKFGRV